jgi:hypothetical protein
MCPPGSCGCSHLSRRCMAVTWDNPLNIVAAAQCMCSGDPLGRGMVLHLLTSLTNFSYLISPSTFSYRSLCQLKCPSGGIQFHLHGPNRTASLRGPKMNITTVVTSHNDIHFFSLIFSTSTTSMTFSKLGIHYCLHALVHRLICLMR